MFGFVADATERIVEHEREGFDGHGSRKIGTRGGRNLIRTIKLFTTTGDADTHITACEALSGTLVTVIDEFSRTTTNVEVQEVVPPDRGEPRKTIKAPPSGGGGGTMTTQYRVEMLFRVRKTG